MQRFEVFLPAHCVREPSPPPRGALCTAQVCDGLIQLVTELELARSAVVASVAALRHQNCEIDEDIARVLQRRVGDVIGVQIEKAEGLLAALGGGNG